MTTLILLIFAAIFYALGTALALVGMRHPQRSRQRLVHGSFITGFVFHTLVLVLHAVRYGGIPIGMFSETVLFFLWCVALVGIFVACFYHVTALSAYILPVLVLFSVGAVALAHRNDHLPKELNRLWTALHTIPIFLGCAFFAVGFAASILYLTQERRLKSKLFEPLMSRLPSLETLDRVARMATLAGFPLYTLGLILGIVWAKSGSAVALRWPPDAVIGVGVATWIVYGVLVHVRLAQITHGRRVAWLTIAGFVLVMIVFLGSFAFGRFHSRAKAPSASSSALCGEGRCIG